MKKYIIILAILTAVVIIGVVVSIGDNNKNQTTTLPKLYQKEDTKPETSVPKDAEKQYRLAEKYEANKDYKKAYHWYKKARESGHSSAQPRLEELYHNGLGTDVYSEEHISHCPECSEAKNYKKITTLKELDKFEHCFKSFEAKSAFYLRRHFIKRAKELQSKELKGIKISRKELLNTITSFADNLGGLSDLCCRDYKDGWFIPEKKEEIRFIGSIEGQKLSNTTFMLLVNWGGRANSTKIFTSKNGKISEVDLNPNEIISKSLEKVIEGGVESGISLYDRMWNVSNIKIAGKKYYEIFFTKYGDAGCCPSLIVAYNEDFNYSGKFYYKVDANDIGFDKCKWKELKIIGKGI